MNVRPARAEDAAAVAEVHVRTWQAAYEHVFGAERLASLDVGARTRRWETWLAEDETVFVAEDDDGRVVAFSWVGASREDDAEGELFAIYALPEAWGSGAGPALMHAALDAMRDAGYRDAILWVVEDNPRARRFYEREGWHLDGRKEEEFLGVRVSEIRYRIWLK
jgi:GNAT superfamily N-acetyltransferase